MRARGLNKTITFMIPKGETNRFNEALDTVEKLATVRAAVESFGSIEKFFSNKIVEVSTCKFRIRFLKGVDLKTTIIFGERKFDITEIIDPFERRKELIIAAKEIF